MWIEDMFETYKWVKLGAEPRITVSMTKKEYKKFKEFLRDKEEKYDIKNDIGG